MQTPPIRIIHQFIVRSVLFLVFALTLNLSVGYAQKTTEFKPGEAYTQALKNGDKFFLAGDYLHALDEFEKALILGPAQKYPQEKIASINKILSDTQLSNKLFESSITLGAKYLAAKDYKNAKTEYLNALRLDPDAQYPKDRLAEISKVYADPEDEALYRIALNNAEKAFIKTEYDEAIGYFEQALVIKPADKAPKTRIADAQRLKTELSLKKAMYAKSIASGDSLLEQKKYTEARAQYVKASTLLAGESYPSGKIASIDQLLASKKAADDTYAAIINEADKLYVARDFDNARIRYQQALTLKPGERYPKSMLEKTGMGQTEVRTTRQRFDDEIANADNLFKASEIDAALIGYQSAATILPNESYPKTKIAEINKMISERNSRHDAYGIAIANGDQAFGAAEYPKALSAYNNALSLQPDEDYPKSRIAAIESLQQNEKALQDSFTKAIARADKDLAAKQFTAALSGYQSALELKPAEKYPREKITEINQILDGQKSLQENYDRYITAADLAFGEKNYDLALSGYKSSLGLKPAESYPKGKIAEINTILGQQKSAQDNFDKAIASANKNFDSKNYAASIADYQSALALKPAEKYPREKITEINQILDSQKSLQENYDRYIKEADLALGEKKYDLALSGYQSSLGLKPAESYPKGKIAEINSILEQQKSLLDSYDKAVASADKNFDSKQYTAAITGYQSALALKPAEKYPQEKITEINGLLEKEKSLQENYNEVIAGADKALGEKNYSVAREGYQSAMGLKPSDTYPQQKITEINTILGQQKLLQENYEKAIASADAAMGQKNYTQALSDYRSASTIKPSETYPQQKITAINAILGEQKTLKDNYDNAIASADKAFEEKKYDAAATGYQAALLIKPDESYPREKIAAIKVLLDQQKAMEENYSKTIADADKALQTKDYPLALSGYQSAAGLKPGEAYAQGKIAEINTLLNKLKTLQESYDKAISEGDKSFAEKKYTQATTLYTSALAIKPNEVYPQDKIAEIKTIQLKQSAVDESYSKAIAAADKSFGDKDFLTAITGYQSAIAIKPEETYPQEKINAVNAILAEDKVKTEQRYHEAITRADVDFAKQNYTDARISYQQAVSIKPGEAYPKEKLTEISNLLLARTKEMKDAYDKVIIDADKAYAARIYDQAIDFYTNAHAAKPDETYPGEMIDKIRKYMAEHSIVNVTHETFLLVNNTEKRFSFKPIDARLRKNNYVVLKARNPGGSKPKVYLNYGHDTAKNGGIVLRSITSDVNNDFIIRISIQDKWYREDNNWLSLYSEGGDIEISSIQIAQGD